MKDTNNKTIESYETNIKKYIQNTPKKKGAVVEDWIGRSIQNLQSGAKILEIGSADGSDAKIIEESGFFVEKTDATKGFVEILKKDDPTSRLLNVLTDDIAKGYDLIIANAVFLHFDIGETEKATAKVFEALNNDGIFALTLKQGKGDAWKNNKGMAPRYFNYWSKDEIVNLLANVGFGNIDACVDSSDGSNATWIMIIAHKV